MFKRALPGINFMPNDFTAPNGEDSSVFKANDRSGTERAPIEENAEKEEIIPL